MKFALGLSLGLLVFVTSASGFAQNTPDAATETGRPVNGFREGIWKSYYPNSNIVRYQGAYHRGKRVGKWVWRYRNGAIQESQEYKNGKKHGPWVSYFLSGAINSQGHFDKAIRDGHWSPR